MSLWITTNTTKYLGTRKSDCMNLKKQFLEDWKHTRNNTLRFIDSIPNKKLSFKPHRNFGTLGKQLRHLADVQECYLKGIKTGVIEFSRKRKDFSMETDKQKLINYFRQQDKDLILMLKIMHETDLRKNIIWKECGKPTIYSTLIYMKEHEIFHQGIFNYALNLQGLNHLDFSSFSKTQSLYSHKQ